MTINYTTLLGLAQPVPGTEANTWGTVVNDSITELVEDAIAGSATASVTSGDWTLTTTGSGAVNQARSAILIPTGTPGVSRNIIAPSSSKAYIVENQSNAAVVVKGSATTGATVAAGTTALVAWDGADFVLVAQDLANATGTLPVSKGGTGQTTYTNGQLLIGNSTGNTLTKATLTAGSGISITNGSGSISIAATGGTGTVTSVGGTGTVNGITLTGTVTSSGNLTLGGTLSGVNLTSQVTGTLPVANGGTGATTLTANNVLLGNGTSALQAVAPGASGNVLTSNGTTWTSAAATASLSGVTESVSPFETALGSGAGAVNTGVNNVFIGYEAGNDNTTGTGNVAVGYRALDVNTIGGSNVAVGSEALGANTTGVSNTAVGHNTLLFNTTGFSNVAVGSSALRNNVYGRYNVAVGDGALQSLAPTNATTNNTGLGYRSVNAISTGVDNTSVGAESGDQVTTGNQNTIIGSGAASSGTNDLTSGSNNILIGYNAAATSATVSNETTIGNSSTTSARIFGDLKFLNSYTEVVFAVSGTTPALAPSNGTIQTWTLTGNSTPTAGTWNAGQSITLMVDDGTAYTITWTSSTFGGTGVIWETDGGTAPTLSTTGYTTIVLWKVGTQVYGARVGNA